MSKPGAQTPSSNESKRRRRKKRKEEQDKEEECEGFMIEWKKEEEDGEEKGEKLGKEKEDGKWKDRKEGVREGSKKGGKEDEKKDGFICRKDKVKMQDSSNISSDKTDLPGCQTRDDSPIHTISERQNLSKNAFLEDTTQNDDFFKVSPPSLKGQHPSSHGNTFYPPLPSLFSTFAPSSYPSSSPYQIPPSSSAEPPLSSLYSSPSNNFPLPPPSSFDHSPSSFPPFSIFPSSPNSLCPPFPSPSSIPLPPSSYRSFYYLKTSFKTEDILNSSFDSIHMEKDFLLKEKKTFGHRRWDEEVRELTVFKGTWKEDSKKMNVEGKSMEVEVKEKQRIRKEEKSRCPCYNNCRIM